MPDPKRTDPSTIHDDEDTVDALPGWEVVTPDPERPGGFRADPTPRTYKEAVEYTRKLYGADALGRICLVRKIRPDAAGGPPVPSVLQAALEALEGHRNWRDHSDSEEALKVWSETMARLEDALRATEHDIEIDRIYHELDEENLWAKFPLGCMLIGSTTPLPHTEAAHVFVLETEHSAKCACGGWTMQIHVDLTRATVEETKTVLQRKHAQHLADVNLDPIEEDEV